MNKEVRMSKTHSCLFSTIGCCCVLPSVSSIHCVIFFYKSPSEYSSSSIHSFIKEFTKRKLKYQVKSTKPFLFLNDSALQWIKDEVVEDVILSKCSIQPDCIHSEVHNYQQMQNHKIVRMIGFE